MADCPFCDDSCLSFNMGFHLIHRHPARLRFLGGREETGYFTCWCGTTLSRYDFVDHIEQVTDRGDLLAHFLAHALGVGHEE